MVFKWKQPTASTVTVFVAIVGALALAPAPALAGIRPEPFIQFDYTMLGLSYDGGGTGGFGGTRQLTISETLFSTASVALKDGLGILDGPAVMAGGAFDVTFQGTVGTGAEGYAITGMFTATDVNMSSPAFQATFTSTKVEVIPAFEGSLVIEGVLQGIDGNPILVNRQVGGDDWVYDGGGGSTVIVQNANGYDAGELFHMAFGVDSVTLGALFDQGVVSGEAGFMHGTVFSAPVPSAAVLGCIGLLVIGGLRRWRAARAY